MATKTVRLPTHLSRAIDGLAADRHTTPSEIIREAAAEYCANARTHSATDRLALLRRLVTYEGSGRGDLAAHSEDYLRKLFHARRRQRPR